jgi:hypothetical protein
MEPLDGLAAGRDFFFLNVAFLRHMARLPRLLPGPGAGSLWRTKVSHHLAYHLTL